MRASPALQRPHSRPKASSLGRPTSVPSPTLAHTCQGCPVVVPAPFGSRVVPLERSRRELSGGAFRIGKTIFLTPFSPLARPPSAPSPTPGRSEFRGGLWVREGLLFASFPTNPVARPEATGNLGCQWGKPLGTWANPPKARQMLFRPFQVLWEACHRAHSTPPWSHGGGVA